LRPNYQEAVDVLAKAQEHLKEAKNVVPPPAEPAQPPLPPAPPTPQPKPALQPLPVAAPVLIQKPAPAAQKTMPAGTAQEHETRGRALTQAGKYPEALAELTSAIQLAPGLATAYNARGYVYLLKHDYQHALADFNDAIRLRPAYPNALQNRVIVLKALGQAAP
jgi:tetratricopeptide (TPR) repeat protein